MIKMSVGRVPGEHWKLEAEPGDMTRSDSRQRQQPAHTLVSGGISGGREVIDNI